MKESATQRALRLYRAGQFKESLQIFKSFRLGLTSGEQRIIQIAAEIESGHGYFYSKLDINPHETIREAKAIIEKIYANT